MSTINPFLLRLFEDYITADREQKDLLESGSKDRLSFGSSEEIRRILSTSGFANEHAGEIDFTAMATEIIAHVDGLISRGEEAYRHRYEVIKTDAALEKIRAESLLNAYMKFHYKPREI